VKVTNTEQWNALAAELASGASGLDVEAVSYGADLPNERDLRLLGRVAGKRVLDLGCGLGQAAIALARQGAHVIALDASDLLLREARTLAEEHEVVVEWHHGDLADLAFLRADSVDAALAIESLDEVDDIDRVFRQVHRVLKPGAPLVFTLEHPAALMVGRDVASNPGALPLGDLVVRRSYSDEAPVVVERHGRPFTIRPHTISGIFGALHRASYRIDQVLEPEPVVTPDPGPIVPPVVVWRARKQGS
jgi:SAM-dependent methyltransferase